MTLTVVMITVSCLLIIALSPHANAQSPCSAMCSDAKKRCLGACFKTRNGAQECINKCHDQHAICQNGCSTVSGRFLRRDEDLLGEWLKSKFD